MFLDNALKYFDYMSKFLFHKKASILAKILGVYKILVRDNNEDIKYHLILMENINYGIISKNTKFNCPDSNIRVYDLKGSNLRRYIDETKNKPGKVLLDSNFILDFDREPVLIEFNVYERLKHALINDTTYLKSLNVIDYSLLIIFKDIKKKNKDETKDIIDSPKNENNFSLIKLGIIDYTRKYTFDKQVESVVKSVRYGQKPTIVNPTEYSERFYNTISKYFVGV
jgi:1-phosphatidylinositol-3-phosphate 5-kinase